MLATVATRRQRVAMLSLDELRWRLAEKGYRHRQVERVLHDVDDAAASPEVFDQVQRFLTADCECVFRAWFGERDYKKHLNLATVQCAQGGITSILDYIRGEV
jgi:hypothetical protein